jgi:hypothetical protein
MLRGRAWQVCLNEARVYLWAMTVTVEIPDSVAASVVPEGTDAARKLLEDAVAQAYRDELIGTATLREVLGLSWHEKEEFLRRYKIFNDLTADELLADVQTSRALRKKHLAEKAAA